jgi:anaerobic magnesium-protoporphyrin IX monomethyl ester cyclase
MPRKKIVLYNPRAVFFTMPLGLLAVGSALDRTRYDVVIVDARLEADPIEALLAALEGAACLGVGVLTGEPIRDAIAASRAAKARFPRLPVVWGGWHPSLFGKGCLEEPSVDATVQAQGEETFHEIVDRLVWGESLRGVAGCTFRNERDEAEQNPPRALKAVDNFASHDYTLLPVKRFFALKGKRQLDYITSQGCFFRCAFCADPLVYGRRWVGLSPERVGTELADLHARYGFDDVNFQDETYFTYADRVAEIAEQILRQGLKISWAATMRADQGDRLPEEVMALCRRSGLRRLIIGVEAGSQAMMDHIKKDIKLEQVFRSAEKCRRHGVAVIFPFIVCFPNESDTSIQASLDVAHRLRAMSPTFSTPIYYFKPYPGTRLTDEAEQYGYVPPKTLEEWANWDWYDSDGPWVTPERARLIERYKYYQEVAFSTSGFWSKPLQKVARWRVEKNRFALPVEKVISDRVRPRQALS